MKTKFSQPYTWLILIAFTLISGCVTMPQNTSGRVVIADENKYVDVRFNDNDRRYIRNYYHKKTKGLPPGLAKKGKIPPGHARKLARHGHLPHDTPYAYLPRHLEENLGHLPSGYIRVRVGQDIVLMNRKTRVIMDVIHDL